MIQNLKETLCLLTVENSVYTLQNKSRSIEHIRESFGIEFIVPFCLTGQCGIFYVEFVAIHEEKSEILSLPLSVRSNITFLLIGTSS